MPVQIQLLELIELTDNFNYKNHGDSEEQNYGDSIIDTFNNSEIFWKKFVTPMTNRITNDINLIRSRTDVSNDLKEIGSYHYSILLNLIYAKECLYSKQKAFFENFYAHISTICDLVEDFMILVYNLILECNDEENSLKEKITEEKFMDLCGIYFKTHYSEDHEHYFNKGKVYSCKLFDKNHILKNYFNGDKSWKKFEDFTIKLRTYRNIVIHNKKLANCVIDGEVFVPKITEIQKYKSWESVFSATPENIQNDFVEMLPQMKQNLDDLKIHLQLLWEKPISDLNKLIYIDKNNKLLTKFDLEFIPESGFVGLSNVDKFIDMPTSGSASSSGNYSPSGKV